MLSCFREAAHPLSVVIIELIVQTIITHNKYDIHLHKKTIKS